MVFAALFDVVGDFNFPHLVNSWGFINNLLGKFGVDPINWIDGVGDSSYWTKMTVLIIYIVWNALPFKILILLGGLQSVNKQYYEAAQIDSTPRWRVFLKITVPLLSPMLAYVIITGFIGGFKEYSSIIGIFGDTMGPVGDPYRLNTMVGFIYRYLPNSREGLVSAAAIILFLIIFAVTMVNLYVSKKKTHY
jgi:multiple sugar transport system permease protein